MSASHMREFWDRRAREDAYFFVDDRRAYRDPGLDNFWSQGEQDLDRLLELLELRIAGSDLALDLGCGVGRLTRAIARRAAHVHGIDVSSEMISRARLQHADVPNITWLLGDGFSLRPLGGQSFDVCISHVVFQHLPDPELTLGYVEELGRVLRPGGVAAFQISNDPSVHQRRRGVLASLRGLGAVTGRRPTGQSDPAWLGSAVDMSDLRAVADRSGLELERVVGEGTQFCLVRARKS